MRVRIYYSVRGYADVEVDDEGMFDDGTCDPDVLSDALCEWYDNASSSEFFEGILEEPQMCDYRTL